jgi:VWFA-related protein
MFLRRPVFLAVLSLTLPSGSRAQEPTPAPRPPLVVPARTELVLADAVVTDKKGSYVTDLTASDFEIKEDGQRREITHFRYLTVEGTVAASTPATGNTQPAGPGPSTMALPDRQATKRTMVIIVDDLTLTFVSRVHTRRMLKNLVDQRLAAGDLLSIVRTGGGIGNLQQFTTDKRLLHAAVDGIPFNLSGRSRSAGDVPQGDPSSRGDAPASATGASSASGGDVAIRAAQQSLDDMIARYDRERHANLTLGMLGAVDSVIRGLQAMPGRKSAVLVSEGFSLQGGREGDTRMREQLLQLIEVANRASVVVYALNPAGLQIVGISASTTLEAGHTPRSFVESAQSQHRDLRAGLRQLAEDTGGFTLFDSNDLDGSVAKVFEDQKGYYLLGFDPGPSADAGAKGRSHRFSIKVLKPGLRVRSRRAFYAREDAEIKPAPATFADTLLSPFAAVDVSVRLTALFNHQQKRGSFLRCLVHFDPRGMTLHDEPDGSRRIEVEAGVQSISANGKLTERAGGAYTLRLSARAMEEALQRGFVLTLDVPVKPGPYQVRAGVRDMASGRAGSASQFVDVPDIAKGRLALSGLMLSGAEAAAAPAATDPSLPDALDSDATPAVRRFRGGRPVVYAFGVYNPDLDPATGKPRLAVVLHLYRDGVRLQAVNVPIQELAPTSPGVVAVGGRLHLGKDMEPGAYTLEVVVLDQLRQGKDAAAVQSIEFELAAS